LADSFKPGGEFPISNSVDDLLLASLARDGDNLETGRYLVTFNEGQESAGLKQLRSCGVYGARFARFRQSGRGNGNIGGRGLPLFL
jgi:hypothetical protein